MGLACLIRDVVPKSVQGQYTEKVGQAAVEPFLVISHSFDGICSRADL